MAQVQAEMLALPRWEVWHQSLRSIVEIRSAALLGLPKHDWVRLAETVDRLVRFVIHKSLVRKLVDHGLLARLHDRRGVVR